MTTAYLLIVFQLISNLLSMKRNFYCFLILFFEFFGIVHNWPKPYMFGLSYMSRFFKLSLRLLIYNLQIHDVPNKTVYQLLGFSATNLNCSSKLRCLHSQENSIAKSGGLNLSNLNIILCWACISLVSSHSSGLLSVNNIYIRIIRCCKSI